MNLRDDVRAGIRLLPKLAGIMPAVALVTPETINEMRRVRGLAPVANAAVVPVIDKLNKTYHENLLVPLRDKLRNIWTAHDPAARRWAILRLAMDHHSWSVAKDGLDLPIATPMSYAMEYLLRPKVRTSVCANHQCTAPYFFPRRGQKFCGEECAGPAQREFKRRWWKAHGEAWRKTRNGKRIPGKRKL